MSWETLKLNWTLDLIWIKGCENYATFEETFKGKQYVALNLHLVHYSLFIQYCYIICVFTFTLGVFHKKINYTLIQNLSVEKKKNIPWKEPPFFFFRVFVFWGFQKTLHLALNGQVIRGRIFQTQSRQSSIEKCLKSTKFSTCQLSKMLPSSKTESRKQKPFWIF